jgi:hypothetical protein
MRLNAWFALLSMIGTAVAPPYSARIDEKTVAFRPNWV